MQLVKPIDRLASRSTRVIVRNRGVTLVELLVALVITSVGLLGVAALQLGTLRNNFDSTKRTQASVLAADITDRMRANRQAAIAGQYETALVDPAPARDTIAHTDVAQWKTDLGRLPSGAGSVHYDPATLTVTVVINWSERGNEQSPTAATVSFTSTTEL